MGRELRRLLVPPARLASPECAATGLLPLEAAELHYLRRVLRFRPGDRLAVVDGCGRLWTALLAAADAVQLEQKPAEPLQLEPAPRLQLQLAMAVPRRDAELVWRMATELGGDVLQPLLAERTNVREKLPLARWGTIVAEAAEQCERLWLPELLPPQPAADWFACGQAQGQTQGLRLLATTRHGDLAMLESALESALVPGLIGWSATGLGPVTLAVGPEGGWSEAEELQAITAGWQPVSLGDTILRTSTAAVAGLARLIAWRDALSASSPSPCP